MTHNELVAELSMSLSRADYILLLLPLLFVVISGLGMLVRGAQTHALGVAAACCSVVLADALFFNPPARE